MYKIIAIMGKAGSGKDTLLKEIISAGDHTNIHEIISYTTRPKRDNEIDGKNYNFISDREFHNKSNKGLMLETSCFNSWYYGTSYEALDENKINIGVFNPEGVQSLLRHDDVEVQVFYIQSSDKERLLRQLLREQTPNVDEIIRRYSADKKDFDNLKFEYKILQNDVPLDLKIHTEYLLSIIQKWKEG